MIRLLLAVLVATSCFAQVERVDNPAILASFANRTFAQLVDGDSWKTEITIMNLNEGFEGFTMRFYGDDGQPLTLSFVDLGNRSLITAALPPFGSVTYRTTGGLGPLKQGWGRIEFNTGVAATAVIRSEVPGRVPLEAVVPFDEDLTRRVAIPYDHLNGFLTGLALANTSEFSSITIQLNFRDESGASIFTTSFPLGPRRHRAFVLSWEYPNMANRKGILEISGGNLQMGIVGLRFGPTGAFSTILPMDNIGW
jgi:hypothetical protein